MTNVFVRATLAALIVGAGASRGGAQTTRTLSQGSGFDLELEGNPSTGYRWRLDVPRSQGLDLVRVEAIGYRPAPIPGGKTVVGAPAPFVFRITCLKAGGARVALAYVGPTGQVSPKSHELQVRCE